MNKIWKLKEIDENKANEITEKYKLNKLVARIIASKDLKIKEVEKFLNPTRNDFYDPFLLPDMDKAVDRIQKAIKKNQKIIIYGDYDADGITSTTILKRFFKDLGVDVDTYIPNRLDEGYGLNKDAIENIVKNKYNLMITVDCGITAIKEVELANSKGLDVIITDHHETLDNLPKATAIIDAKRKDNKYPFKGLAGCGVAFKLTQALCKRLDLNVNQSLKYLDLVSVGTISDIVPLIDENRVITRLGIKLVKVTKNIGLKSLLETANYKNIDSTAISFGISPRINACGRMGHQEDALKLFLTDDPIEARNLARKIENYNRDRQSIEKEIYEQALAKVPIDVHEKSCIILGCDNWHHGVIGIVSSKITEKFYKPSILVCFEGEDGKGSGRSIPGFDLHEAVVNCSQYLTACGGHSMAIGLSLRKKDFQSFKKEFEEYASKKITEEQIPTIEIDEEVTSKDIKINAVRELEILEPFGEENQEPMILFKNLKVDSIRALSEGKHLKLTLKDENNLMIDAIGFNMGELSIEYQIGDKVDIVGNISINLFNDNEKVQFNLKDIRLAV